MISRTSPLLLVLTGVAIALAFSSSRRELRGVAVKATKGALVVKDKVKNAAEKMKQDSCNKAAKAKGRRFAVAATAKVLTLKEKAQIEFKSIVEEAKERRTLRRKEL